MDKINNVLPHMVPDGPMNVETKGTLSAVGDPLGKALQTTLKPTVGVLTGAIGKPSGEAAENVHKVAKHEVGYSQESDDKPYSELSGGESLGGKTPTGSNPFGL